MKHFSTNYPDGVDLAKARCNACGTVLESKRPGDCQVCACGHGCDSDRWSPERHRFIGDVTPLCGCPSLQDA